MSEKTQVRTLRGIASALGISHATVSRALRNDLRVHPDTKKRIQNYANEIGYKPNPLVASLLQQVRSGRHKPANTVLAWINCHELKDAWSTLPYFIPYRLAAQARAKSLGYKIDEFWAADPQVSSKRLEQILCSRGIRGLIVPAYLEKFSQQEMDWSLFSIVGLETEGSTLSNYTHASAAHYENFRIAWDRLRRLGYRKIGLILSQFHESGIAHEWIARFLYEQQLIPDSEKVPFLRLKNDVVNSKHEIEEWMENSTPDCILCCDNELKPTLEEIGFPAPSKIGLAHLHVSEDVKNWSGINRSDEAIAEAAIDALSSQCNRNEYGPRFSPQFFRIQGQWVDGNTTQKL